jgi:accessory gene regulator protein AgrB
MITIAKLHSNTNVNFHAVRNILCIIMSLLMLVVIEMLFEVRFASQGENHY